MRCRRLRIQAGSNVTVTPLGSGVDGVLVAKQHRPAAERQQPVPDRHRIEVLEDFAVERQVVLRLDRLEPPTGLELAQSAVAGPAGR